ncbi:hypothetical protein [Streptomyces sp. SCL15-4]|uniref:hypothetical protein n=1 Tax=Streptomyces sp. SCL15-4 TaxID=2967221 RepID=UPI0029663CE7|nr:hypothetical protein [Streptomyces sp. SCL15-4]
MLTALTAPDGNTGESPAADQHDGPDPLHRAAEEIKRELSTALEEARSGLASLQHEITHPRGAVEGLQPRLGSSPKPRPPPCTNGSRTA